MKNRWTSVATGGYLALSLGLVGAACGPEQSPPDEPIEQVMEAPQELAGQYPAAGQCQFYKGGGTTGVHFYACCNVGGACDPNHTYDSASNGDYCQQNADGTTSGGGSPSSAPFAATCDDITSCNTRCTNRAPNIPGLCWVYTLCFKTCLKKKAAAAAGATTGAGGGSTGSGGSGGGEDSFTCDSSDDPDNECAPCEEPDGGTGGGSSTGSTGASTSGAGGGGGSSGSSGSTTGVGGGGGSSSSSGSTTGVGGGSSGSSGSYGSGGSGGTGGYGASGTGGYGGYGGSGGWH